MSARITNKIFSAINGCLLLLILIIIVYPLYYTVIASFSDPELVVSGKVLLTIKKFTLDAYRNIVSNNSIIIGYRNSILYTVIGTLYDLCLTIPAAYALSRKELKGRNFFMGIFVFTMYFSGGMIPQYMLIDRLNLIDTFWVMIIPSGLSVFNLIVARTYFNSNFSQELNDAAKIDGCGEFGVFFRIVLPVSGAIIAVMSLYYAVGHWNSFFPALLYINDSKLYPLQLVLRNILVLNQTMLMDIESLTTDQVSLAVRLSYLAETMKYSLVFIASVPMLIAYPFVQKYFVKGVMVGAVKG
ncbi:MAG TPA: carbohydrate ABC transporter permease [Clostridiales bacterium]|nr:carbohydrate ABC transporter permease [Clostridiales bacterium]